MPSSPQPGPKPNIKKAQAVAAQAKKQAKKNLAVAQDSFKQEFALMASDVKNSLFGWIQKFEKFRDIVKNNYELGRMHLGLGNLQDAVLRFKFVLWMEPGHVDSMYYLGATYMAMGKKPEAAQWFRKVLKLKPDFAEAGFLLAVASGKPVSGEAMPATMPLTLAEEYFDGAAAGYNLQQLEVLKYEGHIQLDNTLRSCLTPGRMDHVVLELGVGTGLCGPGMRDVAAHLTGVDISARMLEEAMQVVDNKGKKIYDALIKREAVEFLGDCQEKGYDIVMSSGMFSYMGSLEQVFEQSHRVLREGGVFAFTADVNEGDGVRFVPADARYAFSKEYLQGLAAKFGFKELRFKDHAVYADYPAWICVYQK